MKRIWDHANTFHLAPEDPGEAFNMVAITTIDNLWHLAIRTADSHAHAPVWQGNREKQSFLCHAKAFPEEAQYLAGLLDTVALGQYLRESIFWGCSWDRVTACMASVIAPPRDAYFHL